MAERCPACKSEMQHVDGFGNKTSAEWYYCHNQACVLRAHSFRSDQLAAINATRAAAVAEAVRPLLGGLTDAKSAICANCNGGSIYTCPLCESVKAIDGHIAYARRPEASRG